VKTGTTLLTDGHRSYPGLTDYRHDPAILSTVRGHKSLDRSRRVIRDSGETDAPRPSIQVFRSFPPWLSLVCSAVDHLDSTSDKDLPGFHGIEKAVVGPERNFGLVDLHHALQRLAVGINYKNARSVTSGLDGPMAENQMPEFCQARIPLFAQPV
jgi:hypothetical protein